MLISCPECSYLCYSFLTDKKANKLPKTTRCSCTILWITKVKSTRPTIICMPTKSPAATWSPKVDEVWCHSLLTGGDGGRRRPYVVSYYCNCNLGTKSRSLCHADREIVCRGCRVLPYKMLYMMYKIQTHAGLGCSRPCCWSTLSSLFQSWGILLACWATSPYESDQLILETFWTMSSFRSSS